jgi:hypothetical protein
MKIIFLNEIRFIIQLPSNSTYVSMLTLPSPHIFLSIDYTYALGKKYD